MKSALFALALSAGLLAGATSASAASVLAQYYRVIPLNPATSGDFENLCCSTAVEVASMLSNGLPQWTGGEAIQEKNANNEILWWTPDGTHIQNDGTQIVSLPFSDGDFFPSQGTGPNAANGFQTAVFSGFFKTTGASTQLDFNFRSDDDLFLFIDGKYVDSDLDGIHAPRDDMFSTSVGAGLHTFKLFYADRHTSQAELHFGVAGVNLTAGVPEPATWAMMILGFGGVGATLRRRRTLGLAA